jgi:hypothetical protein
MYDGRVFTAVRGWFTVFLFIATAGGAAAGINPLRWITGVGGVVAAAPFVPVVAFTDTTRERGEGRLANVFTDRVDRTVFQEPEMSADSFGQEGPPNDDAGHDDGSDDEILQNRLGSL